MLSLWGAVVDARGFDQAGDGLLVLRGEKTVKNCFAGRYGPNGAHLVELARHSDDVLGVFLAMAGREHLMAALKLEASADAIADLLAAVRRLGETDER